MASSIDPSTPQQSPPPLAEEDVQLVRAAVDARNTHSFCWCMQLAATVARVRVCLCVYELKHWHGAALGSLREALNAVNTNVHCVYLPAQIVRLLRALRVPACADCASAACFGCSCLCRLCECCVRCVCLPAQIMQAVCIATCKCLPPAQVRGSTSAYAPEPAGAYKPAGALLSGAALLKPPLFSAMEHCSLAI